MRRLAENKVRVVLLGLVLVPAALFGFKLVTGVGPSLPGPKLRETLGIVEPFGACVPQPDRIRHPSEPIATSAARWRREPDVEAFADEEVRAAAVDGVVYAGMATRPNEEGSIFNALESFFEYRPERGSLRRLPPIPVPAHHSVTIAREGHVYVFGGFTDGLASRRVWRYTPETRRWQAMADMPRARGAFGGDVIDGRFYAAGGASSALQQFPRVYKVLDVYDFRTGTWSRGPIMPTARHHFGAAAVSGRLYAVGGRSNRSQELNTFESFDPASGRWERLAPLPQGVGGLQAIGWKGRFIAIGGGDDGKGRWITPATWSYSPAERSWTRLADLEVPRHGFGAVVANGRLYALGGSPCARYGRTPAVESVALP